MRLLKPILVARLPKRYLHGACTKCGNKHRVEICEFAGNPGWATSVKTCGYDLNRPANVNPDDPWPAPIFDKNGDCTNPPYTPNPCKGQVFIACWDGPTAMENTFELLAWLKEHGHTPKALEGIITGVLADAADVLAPPETPQEMGWVSQSGAP